MRNRLLALEKRYKDVPKARDGVHVTALVCEPGGALTRSATRVQKREPHPDIGDWWTLYDYGLDTVKTWDKRRALS